MCIQADAPPFIKEQLKYLRNNTGMRVAMSAVVALLILNFADEHFNDARYGRAMTSIFFKWSDHLVRHPWAKNQQTFL